MIQLYSVFRKNVSISKHKDLPKKERKLKTDSMPYLLPFLPFLVSLGGWLRSRSAISWKNGAFLYQMDEIRSDILSSAKIREVERIPN